MPDSIPAFAGTHPGGFPPEFTPHFDALMRGGNDMKKGLTTGPLSMQPIRILVTGGAGFIGSFLVDKLIDLGFRVRIFDNLENQVHHGKVPDYLNPRAEFIRGDVRDPNALLKALQGISVVYHLAARVGVAQSNYEISSYVQTNIVGTANLLETIVNHKLPVRKIILAASNTSYGEGLSRCKQCKIVKPQLRTIEQLTQGKWEVLCPKCGHILKSIDTTEETPLKANSVYALTKNVQENLVMLFGKLYQIPVVSLRLFNVYGPRQSLSNPYTGVTAIFISRLKNGKPPVIYEDGVQSRDFVSVHDVVRAFILAMEKHKADYQCLNIGTGQSTTIGEVADLLASLLKKKIIPVFPGEFRLNDVRHCAADVTKAKKLLGWQPRISLKKGFVELVAWSANKSAVDAFDAAAAELRHKKLSYETEGGS